MVRLQIDVFGASGLKNDDEESTPYCIVELSYEDPDWAQKQNTQNAESATDPEWNESYQFRLKPEGPVIINATVMSGNEENDVVLGKFSMQIDEYEPEMEIEDEYTLKLDEEDADVGNLHLSLAFIESLQEVVAKSPRGRTLITRINNDKGDTDSLCNEAVQQARDKYKVFLRNNASSLLQNAKEVKIRNRQLEEEEEDNGENPNENHASDGEDYDAEEN